MREKINPSRRRFLAGTALVTAAVPVMQAAASFANAAEGEADLTGKSILITGTSSGFGRLAAEHFARLGAKVFATMRNLPRLKPKSLQA